MKRRKMSFCHFLVYFVMYLLFQNPIGKHEKWENVHDQCITHFSQEDIMDVLIEVCKTASMEPPEVVWLLLEIFCYYFRYEQPKTLVTDAKTSGESHLKALMDKERLKKVGNNRRRTGRHARFGGMTKVKTMGGISIRRGYNKEIETVGEQMNMRVSKASKHKRSVKFRHYTNDGVRRNALQILDNFLAHGFRPLVTIVRRNIENYAEMDLEKLGDLPLRYLHFIGFMMETHRLRQRQHFQVEKNKAKKEKTEAPKHCYNGFNVESCLNLDFLAWVLDRLKQYLENVKKNKLLCPPIEQCENSLYCLKEWIRSVYSMKQYGNKANNVNGRILIRNLVTNEHQWIY
eukprot:UN34138